MIIMRDLDWQFGISNLAGDFNMNFFDRDRQICSKNWSFRKIEIRKIGDIFAINYSEKNLDHQSSSKNPVVSKNWRSNYRGSTVFQSLNIVSIACSYHIILIFLLCKYICLSMCNEKQSAQLLSLLVYVEGWSQDYCKSDGCFSQYLISSPWRHYEDYNISFCKQWKFRCHCSYEQWHLNFHCLQRGPNCP